MHKWRWASYLFLLLPLWGSWMVGDATFFWCVVYSALLTGVCLYELTSVRPIFEIMGRVLICLWPISAIFMWTWFDDFSIIFSTTVLSLAGGLMLICTHIFGGALLRFLKYVGLFVPRERSVPPPSGFAPPSSVPTAPSPRPSRPKVPSIPVE